MTVIKAGMKIALYAFHLLWIMGLQTPVLWFCKGKASYFLPYFFHLACAATIGLKIKTYGKQVRNQQTLYVCNHMSYMDITAIGTVVKEASFIAKKDTKTMPIYGYLSKMQQTAYISRDRKDVINERNTLDTMIAEGKSLILFPEGTTTDGTTVLPFKSSLFGIVLKENIKNNLTVQPMTIKLIEVDGKPATSKAVRDQYAWTTEMSDDLNEHLWNFLKTKGARLEVTFHAPLSARDYTDRKELAQKAHEICLKGLIGGESKCTVDSNTKAA